MSISTQLSPCIELQHITQFSDFINQNGRLVKKNSEMAEMHPMGDSNSQGGPAGMENAILPQTGRQMYVVSVQTFVK